MVNCRAAETEFTVHCSTGFRDFSFYPRESVGRVFGHILWRFSGFARLLPRKNYRLKYSWATLGIVAIVEESVTCGNSLLNGLDLLKPVPVGPDLLG